MYDARELMIRIQLPGAPGLARFETRASRMHQVGKLVGSMVFSFGTLH